MAEKRSRRRFTAEFKGQAVKRLLEGGRGLSEVATELGVSSGQLSAWRTEHLAAGSAEALAQRKAEEAELQRLKCLEQAAGRGEPDPQEGGGLAAFARTGGARQQVRARDRVSRFAFVAVERANHAVARLCRVIGASISGFYAWLRAIPAVQSRAETEAELRGHIGRIFSAGRQIYGSPRVHAELRREGWRHSRRRIAGLMREMGLQARQGRRRAPRTTDSRHNLPIAPNLLGRHFTAERPDMVWLADISYIPTGEGWLYLAAIKDLATREIVGWSMADHLRAGLCVDALVMALQRCDPPRGLIHHGDRGVQYAAGPYREVLERHGIRQSMSRKGNCLDNAPMESFFASLKKEHVHQARFSTREEARAAVFDYIEIFYNRQRLHSAIGYRTPAEARASMGGITLRQAA
jgi:putative transposase